MKRVRVPIWPAMVCVPAMAIGLVAASPAAAAPSGDSAQLLIRGVIEPKCAFTTVPGEADLGALHMGQVQQIGTLAFSCNLASSGSVTLTVQSDNGALKRDGGPETVGYSAAWDIQGRSGDYGDAANAVSPLTFSLQSGSAGSIQSGAYSIKITGAADTLVAGTYRDRITYTITP